MVKSTIPLVRSYFNNWTLESVWKLLSPKVFHSSSTTKSSESSRKNDGGKTKVHIIEKGKLEKIFGVQKLHEDRVIARRKF